MTDLDRLDALAAWLAEQEWIPTSAEQSILIFANAAVDSLVAENKALRTAADAAFDAWSMDQYAGLENAMRELRRLTALHHKDGATS